jgi:two-component system NarL family response regulator
MHIRVLVVDDFPLTREGVTAALETDPAIEVVGQAADADDGVAMALKLRPDVVLVDMRMPGSGGLVLLERLRSDLPETKLLVLSGVESSDMVLEAISAGAAGYISKRAARDELCGAVVTVHGGGSVVSPSLAGILLREYAGSSRGEGTSARPLITRREQEILRLVSQGLTDKEIGGQLFISARTVQNHLTKVREKTGLGRRSELARWAVEHSIA